MFLVFLAALRRSTEFGRATALGCQVGELTVASGDFTCELLEAHLTVQTDEIVDVALATGQRILARLGRAIASAHQSTAPPRM